MPDDKSSPDAVPPPKKPEEKPAPADVPPPQKAAGKPATTGREVGAGAGIAEQILEVHRLAGQESAPVPPLPQTPQFSAEAEDGFGKLMSLLTHLGSAMSQTSQHESQAKVQIRLAEETTAQVAIRADMHKGWALAGVLAVGALAIAFAVGCAMWTGHPDTAKDILLATIPAIAAGLGGYGWGSAREGKKRKKDDGE